MKYMSGSLLCINLVGSTIRFCACLDHLSVRVMTLPTVVCRPKSVINIHRVLHRALSSTVHEGVLSYDVLEPAQPPALPSSRVSRAPDAGEASIGADREAATTVASLILRRCDGREGGRKGVRRTRSRNEEHADPSRFRRSMGPSTRSGGRT